MQEKKDGTRKDKTSDVMDEKKDDDGTANERDWVEAREMREKKVESSPIKDEGYSLLDQDEGYSILDQGDKDEAESSIPQYLTTTEKKKGPEFQVWDEHASPV